MNCWLEGRALRRAYSRCRENRGCAGADGVSLVEFSRELDSELERLREEVIGGGYWAWPLRRVVVEKRPGAAETRTLLVAAVRDRVLQTAVAAYLEPFLEAEFNESSFGYRRGRSVRMAVERVSAYFRPSVPTLMRQFSWS